MSNLIPQVAAELTLVTQAPVLCDCKVTCRAPAIGAIARQLNRGR